MRSKRARRNRSGERGAAMVEGIVVMSVMVGFLGLIQHTQAAYRLKLDVQQRARSEVLYYASHACKGAKPEGLGDGARGNPPPDANGGGPNPAVNAANRSGASERSALDQSWGSVSFSLTKRTSGIVKSAYSAGNGISYYPAVLDSDVTGASSSICNEPDYGNALVAWLSFAINFARSGGGIANLFD